MNYSVFLLGFAVSLLVGCSVPVRPIPDQQPQVLAARQKLAAGGGATKLVAAVKVAGETSKFIVLVNREFNRELFKEDRVDDKVTLRFNPDTDIVSITVSLDSRSYNLVTYPALISLEHRSKNLSAVTLKNWWVCGNKVYTSPPPYWGGYYLVNTDEAYIYARR